MTCTNRSNAMTPITKIKAKARKTYSSVLNCKGGHFPFLGKELPNFDHFLTKKVLYFKKYL